MRLKKYIIGLYFTLFKKDSSKRCLFWGIYAMLTTLYSAYTFIKVVTGQLGHHEIWRIICSFISFLIFLIFFVIILKKIFKGQ